MKETNPRSLSNDKVNIKIKLALLWTSLMFLYIYADYFQLMVPNKIEKIISLQTPVGPTTPGLLVIFSTILIIPSLMIFLSVFLTPPINKWLNIVVAFIYACISMLIIISGIGDAWRNFYVLINSVELVVFVLIIIQAWRWPKESYA